MLWAPVPALIAYTPPLRLLGWAFCQPGALRDVFKAVRRPKVWAVYQVMALRLDYVHAALRDESEALCGVPESIQATIFKQKRAKTKRKKIFLVSYSSLANY